MDAIDLILQGFPGSKLLMDTEPLTRNTKKHQGSWVTAGARDRGRVTRQVRECTACELSCGMSDEGWSPVPVRLPELRASFSAQFGQWAAVGEAPGQTESQRGEPFIGKAGKLFKAMCEKAGLDWKLGTKLNTVSCFPHSGRGKGITIMQPGESQMQACRKNLVDQLGLLTVPYVLLVGSYAVKAWRPDLKVTATRGKLFTWTIKGVGGFYVFPLTHPAAALRQQALREPIINDLRTFSNLVNSSDLTPGDLLTNECIVCNQPASHHDPDYVGYCDRHWARYGGAWEVARGYWDKPKQYQSMGKGRKKRVLSDGQQQLL